MQNCKPDSTELLVERNGVDGGRVAREAGRWAERTRGGARMERLGAVVATVVMETIWVATPRSHATELTRNGVACYSVMRVSAVWWAEVYVGDVRVRVEDLEETWGQEHTLAVLLKK